MAMIGFLQTGLAGGAINASSPVYTIQHNFSPNKVNVWSYGTLQRVSINDDDASVGIWIDNFDGAKKPGTTHTPGIVALNCSWVNFRMAATDCLVWGVFTSEFFD